MKATYQELTTIGDGDLVLINWPDAPNFGIKGTRNDNPFVVVLGRAFGNLHGPYVLFKEDQQLVEHAISFGRNWTFDFKPDAINFNNPGRPELGTLVVAPQGLCVHCNTEGGREFVSYKGTFVEHGLFPFIQDWRLILLGDGDAVIDIYPPKEN